MRMLNYLPWSIFNFLSRPPNPTRILLPWFHPPTILLQQRLFSFKSTKPWKLNFMLLLLKQLWLPTKKSFWIEFDLFHAFFSGLFQVKEIQRKLYSMSCIGIFWEWMNFWEWFQCLYVILTFTNVQKPSEYNFNNSFVSAIASVHQSVELCTRTSKVCC